MSWFENNPLGVVLAAAAGMLLLITLLLGWAWSWPVSSGTDSAADEAQAAQAVPKLDSDLAPLREYQVVNDRPVFNETRRPQIEVEEEEEAPVIVGPTVAATPEVRLTGVVITPKAKYVTLTPNEEGEPLIIREGMPLEGEYVGWSVSRIDARNATLKSTDGDALKIELAVHDAMIAEPPKPEPAKSEDEEAEGSGEGEPLSRADEIRQRIQERREQLRREAEEAEDKEQAEKTTQRNEYQEAIRSMVNRNRQPKDKKPDEDED